MFIRATDWTRWPNRPVSALVGNVADLKKSALGTASSTQGAVLADATGQTDNQLVASLPEHLSELKHRVDGTKTAAHELM